MNAFLSNDDFDNRLKNLAEDAESTLPEGSWERLQLKKEKLSNKKRIRLWMYFSLSAVLLLITAVVLYNTPAFRGNRSDLKQDISIKDKTPPPSDNKVPSGETGNTIADANPSQQITAQSQTTTQNNTSAFVSDKPVAKNKNVSRKQVREFSLPEKTEEKATDHYLTDEFSETTYIDRDTSILKDSSLTAEVPKTKDTTVASENNNSLLTLDPTITDKKKKELTGNEVHIGFVYGLNLPWILNQNTYGEFGGKELAYKLDFGSSYGFTVGYDVQKRFGLQTGIIIHSQQGQKYHDTFSIGTFDREVALEYMHIPLLYKLKRSLSAKSNSLMLNIIVGAQYGHLKKATETLNDVTTDITDRFHRSEIGFVFNIETDYYFSNSLFLTFGIDTYIGNNINQKDWMQYVSHAHGRSYNMMAGATFGLSYYFPVK